MSKARKKIFPKPVQRLNSKSALDLGKNSNSFLDISKIAMYNQSIRPSARKPLTKLQEAMLARTKKQV